MTSVDWKADNLRRGTKPGGSWASVVLGAAQPVSGNPSPFATPPPLPSPSSLRHAPPAALLPPAAQGKLGRKGGKSKKKPKPKPSESTSLVDFIQDRRLAAKGSGIGKGKGKGSGKGSISGGVKAGRGRGEKERAAEREKKKKGVVVSLEKLEEQGLRQKGSSRSKKLSSLKKRIIKERELRSYLLTPSLQPCPLELHPAALGAGNVEVTEPYDATRMHPVFFAEICHNTDNCGAENQGEEDMLAVAELEKQEREKEGLEAKEKPKEKSKSKYYQTPVSQRTAVPRTLEKGSGVYRDYVAQAFSTELEEALTAMVSKLHELQRRQQMRDPLKAKLRRRFVVGLREVQKGVKLGKVKCVVLAANIEMGMQGLIEAGIDTIVHNLIAACEPDPAIGRARVPIVFAPSRSRLGSALAKHMSISALGIYSPDGANEEYKTVLRLAKELQEVWKERVDKERASKEWIRCSRCSQVALKTYFLCQNCHNSYCPQCKQSLKDRRVKCTGPKPSQDIDQEKDKSCAPTCIAISRSIPVPMDINEKAKKTAIQPPKSASSRSPSAPKMGSPHWQSQDMYIQQFGMDSAAYSAAYYPPGTNPLAPAYAASSPYYPATYNPYPLTFKNTPLSSEAKEFIPRSMSVTVRKE